MSSAAARLASLSKHLGELDRTIVTTAGKVVVKALLTQVAQDTGGDRRMSGFGSRGSALDVDVKPLGAAAVRITPARRQAGMWTILDSGATPHDVVAKGAPIKGKGAQRKRRQRDLDIAFGATGAFKGVKPLHFGSNGFYYRVHNVRSPAKRTWARGRDRGVGAAVKAVRD